MNFFEALTLIQTQKIRHFPVILFGSSFWSGLIEWLEQRVLTTGCIKQEDLQLFHLVDEVDQVLPIIQSHYKNLSTQHDPEQRTML
jgi:hypothetical protein